MVYITGNPANRTTGQKWLRRIMGIAAVCAILYGLYLVPYDILREERLRLFGETHTMGLVTEVRSNTIQPDQPRFVIRYKYVDKDGFAREAEAPVPAAIWKTVHPGDRLEVFYVQSRPELSRIPGELEPSFQIWLRSVLH